jgi:hypothetical protein
MLKLEKFSFHFKPFFGPLLLLCLHYVHNVDAVAVLGRASFRLQMMGGGFGPSTSKPNVVKSVNIDGKISPGSGGSKSVSKGDGLSYSEHCPSLSRKFPMMRCVHNDPPIFEIDDFLSEAVCDSFIERSDKDG